jgi:outer membrane protein assembly factor BamB
MKKMTLILALTLLFSLLMGSVMAADSHQFRGPNRDGKFWETGLLKAWPKSGPPIAWVKEGFGHGYSSVSIVNDTIYLPVTFDKEEAFVYALDLDGNVKFKLPYGTETDDRQSPGNRATPTIEGNRLYIISGMCVVHCFELDTQKKLWSVDAFKKFKGKETRWDFSESPLVDGNKVYCAPGGPDASIVALDKMTGKTIWTSKGLSDPSGYCSPDIIEHNGNRILVTMTATLVVGLNPETGAVLWKHLHKTDYDIHATKPVYEDGMIYYSAGYGSGGGMLVLSEDGRSVTPKWTDKSLDCQHHGVVLLDGYIYGAGHKGKKLTCLELKTGKIMWQAPEVTQGVTIYADGMLYVYEGPKAGVVSLIKPNPHKYERMGSFKVTQGTNKHWAHPAIANGRLYLHHGDALIAYDIKAPEKGFKPIFNGKDLSGWDGDPQLWSVKDGAIRGETTPEVKANGNTFLVWEGGKTKDFELRLSFRCNATNNSGIQYRSVQDTGNARNKWRVRGYQHEIRNQNILPSVSGFIYDEGGTLGRRGRACLVGEKAVYGADGKKIIETLITADQYKTLFRLDQWNDVAIRCKGNHIQHYTNGKLVLDFVDGHEKARLDGILGLQLHAGNPMWVEFKDIRIKTLK